MNVIGGKYKALIIYELISGTKRYNEIQKALPQATPRMLSKQLKELEDDGVIKRVLYPIVPPKTEYSLTEMGDHPCSYYGSPMQMGRTLFQNWRGFPSHMMNRQIKQSIQSAG